MASYVVYGQRAAVAIHRGFACTREELPGELRRAAAEQAGLTGMTGWECVEGREAADRIALAYCLERLKDYPLTAQEMRWINEGAAAAMRA
jgi:hypothetical protein